MSKDKAPPLLSASKTYEDWTSLIDLWKDFRSLDKDKQAPAIVLSLEGKAQTAALEIPKADLTKDDGVDTLIKKLDTIYLKDSLSIKFVCLENFENLKRSEGTSIKDYLEEFQRRYNKVKSKGITYSDDVLAFRLLKADLSPRDEQLVKATITDMKYDEIKTKLTKIYSEGPSEASTSTSISVKVEEPTFHSSSNVEYDECIQSEEFTEYDADIPDSDQCDIETYYANYRGFRQGKFTPTNFQRRYHQPRSSNTNPQLKLNIQSA